jgi:hypothetical protein
MRILKSSIFRSLPFFIFIALTFGGCKPVTETVVPTMNQETLVAAVVQTVNAQNTEQSLLNPTATASSTPIPATLTSPPPTETPTETLIPSDTPTVQPAYSAAVIYVVAYPEDKREYVGNERFSIALGFRNTGTQTWEAGTNVKLVSFTGEVTVQVETSVNKTVAPGEKVEFNLWAFGSEMYGDHTFAFQLFTSTGLAIPGGYATFTYTSV